MLKILLRITIAVTLLLGCRDLNAQYVWRHKACLPFGTLCNAFAINNYGYIINEKSTTPEVWRYDPATNSWLQKNNFPGASNGVSVFVINDTAYAGLGLDSNGNFHSDFWQYNTAADHWVQIAAYPGAARYTAMAFALNGKGYIGCGKNGGTAYRDFYQYDPLSNAWASKAIFPGRIRQCGFGLAAGAFGYMGLGFDANAGTLLFSDCYKYNDTTNSWSAIANFAGGKRMNAGCFTIHDTMYLSTGGYGVASSGSDSFYHTDCWRYDQAADSWVQEQNFSCLAQGRQVDGGFAINGHGYIVGGRIETTSYFCNDLLQFGPVDSSFVEQSYILGADTNYCNNFTRTFSVSDSCAVWSNGFIGGSITISDSGSYWVLYNDNCGLYIDTIHLTTSTILAVVSVTNADCGLSDGSVNIIASLGKPPYSYSWANGDTTATISGLAPGIYSVTASDFDGCTANVNALVTSSTPDSVNIAALPQVICANDSSIICAPAGFASYQWNTGATTPCITTQLAGNYYLTVTDAGNCTAASNRVSVNVLPFEPISISVNEDTLWVLSGASYQWFYNDSLIAGATSNILIASLPGDYSVFVTDSNGCLGTSNAVFIKTGVEEIKGDKISIYPNPLNSGNWQLIVPTDMIGSIAAIYDDNGRLVYQSEIRNQKSEIVFALSSGVYHLRIQTPNGVLVKKLVKF